MFRLLNILLYFITAWLSLFITSDLNAQQVRISASVDSTNYLIGDWISVHVSIDHPDGVEVLWQNPLAIDSGSFEKLSESRPDTIQQRGFITENKVIIFTTFDTGVLRIPSFTFYYRQNNHTYNETTSPLPVYMSAVPVDTAKSFRPIKPPMTLAADQIRMWMYATSALTLIVIGIFYWQYRKQRRKKFNETKKEIDIDTRLPHEKALDELIDLEKEKLWQQDNVKEYYTRITQVIREYIERGLRVPAMENTTREIIALLRKKSLDPSILKHLHDDLVMADLVKFAKVEPPEELHLRILQTAKDLVEKTKPATVEKEVLQP